MSGGSLNYVYSQVEDTAREVLSRAENPLHRAFGEHLIKVAKALHDLEWVWSLDYGPGDEVEAIKAVVQSYDIIESATKNARKALQELQDALSSRVKGNDTE